MDPRISGTTSGVRVFTILVLSGSLFFLIYQMGRKRMGNPKNPDAVNEAAASSSSSSRGLARNSKGYFSHHYERAYPNNASLSRALDSPNSLRTIGGVGGMKFASSSSKKSSDVGSRYGMEHNSSESHEGTSVSSDLSEDAMEMGSYMLPRRPSSANSGAGSLNSGQRASEAIHYNHEQSFLEHLRHNSSLNAQRRSRNNFLVPRNLGDMSLIEQRGGLQRQSNKEVSGVPRGKDIPGQEWEPKWPHFQPRFSESLCTFLCSQSLHPVCYDGPQKGGSPCRGIHSCGGSFQWRQQQPGIIIHSPRL